MDSDNKKSLIKTTIKLKKKVNKLKKNLNINKKLNNLKIPYTNLYNADMVKFMNENEYVKFPQFFSN